MRRCTLAAALLLAAGPATAANGVAEDCTAPGVKIQVLGSGGETVQAGRAGSGYLVWIDGKARLLIDTGSGTALRFAESGAQAVDLDAILYTHLHTDHAADLPALVGLAVSEGRQRVLSLYGPVGNASTPSAPSTVAFVRTLLDGARGAYRHLGHVLSPLTRGRFKLEVHDVRRRAPSMGARARRTAQDSTLPVLDHNDYRISAAYVSHGNYPALAWRIEAGDRSVVFTGDTSGAGDALARLAQDAELLVANHAVPEDASTEERVLHMPPSAIGRLANGINAKRVVLSHRTPQTLGRETVTLAAIGAHYPGPVAFADDLACFAAP